MKKNTLLLLTCGIIASTTNVKSMEKKNINNTTDDFVIIDKKSLDNQPQKSQASYFSYLNYINPVLGAKKVWGYGKNYLKKTPQNNNLEQESKQLVTVMETRNKLEKKKIDHEIKEVYNKSNKINKVISSFNLQETKKPKKITLAGIDLTKQIDRNLKQHLETGKKLPQGITQRLIIESRDDLDNIIKPVLNASITATQGSFAFFLKPKLITFNEQSVKEDILNIKDRKNKKNALIKLRHNKTLLKKIIKILKLKQPLFAIADNKKVVIYTLQGKQIASLDKKHITIPTGKKTASYKSKSFSIKQNSSSIDVKRDNKKLLSITDQNADEVTALDMCPQSGADIIITSAKNGSITVWSLQHFRGMSAKQVVLVIKLQLLKKARKSVKLSADWLEVYSSLDKTLQSHLSGQVKNGMVNSIISSVSFGYFGH